MMRRVRGRLDGMISAFITSRPLTNLIGTPALAAAYLESALPGWKKRRVRAAVLAVALALSGMLTVAAPAHAAGGVFYEINVNGACVDTYNDRYQSAYVANLWNPYTWWCAHHRVGYPYEWWYEGGVNFQAWCNHHYPGSSAVVADSWASRYPAFRWRCRANQEIKYRL